MYQRAIKQLAAKPAALPTYPACEDIEAGGLPTGLLRVLLAIVGQTQPRLGLARSFQRTERRFTIATGPVVTIFYLKLPAHVIVGGVKKPDQPVDLVPGLRPPRHSGRGGVGPGMKATRKKMVPENDAVDLLRVRACKSVRVSGMKPLP